MASRGFLIRFIDIGLIVLFGFLMISDIDMLSRVELASEGVAMEVETPEDLDVRAFIIVEVGPDGRYLVSDSREAEADTTEAASNSTLAEALLALRSVHANMGLETTVLIQPHPASLVQATVDVMDLCDRLSLPKSLQMDIEIEPAADRDRSGAP